MYIIGSHYLYMEQSNPYITNGVFEVFVGEPHNIIIGIYAYVPVTDGYTNHSPHGENSIYVMRATNPRNKYYGHNEHMVRFEKYFGDRTDEEKSKIYEQVFTKSIEEIELTENFVELCKEIVNLQDELSTLLLNDYKTNSRKFVILNKITSIKKQLLSDPICSLISNTSWFDICKNNLEQGTKLFKEGKYDDAIQLYKKGNHWAYEMSEKITYHLLSAYCKKGDIDKALEYLRQYACNNVNYVAIIADNDMEILKETPEFINIVRKMHKYATEKNYYIYDDDDTNEENIKLTYSKQKIAKKYLKEHDIEADT